jgi:hypothetical protein
MEWVVSVIDGSQPKGAKQKIRGRKLRNCVSWQEALKRKDVKEVGHKTTFLCIYLPQMYFVGS